MLVNTSLKDEAAPELALFIRVLEGGGAQKDAVLLANALSRRGVKVVILTLAQRGRLAALVAPDVPVITVEATQLRSAVPALRRTIAAVAPRVVMSSEAAANVVTFLAVRSLPAAVRPRLLLREVASPSVARVSDPYLQNRLAYRVVPWVYSRADRVLTLTQGGRKDLIENFKVPAERIDVLASNAVIDPVAEKRLASAAETNAPREPGLIVSVGRLSPEKDQLLIVEALARSPGLGQARLILIGDGPLRPAIEQRMMQLGLTDRVVLAGHQDDPFAWLLKAELAVCSSRFEGLGNAVIEALACGTPVVSTDCPWGPREILADGVFGELVPVGDADQLGAAMARALRVQSANVDRGTLRQRAGVYTSDRAAAALIDVLAAV